jgi:GNAT superfamily N-acetyltransferase
MRAQEFITETINTGILNKRFRHKQVIGDYTYKASVEMFMGEPILSIKAYDGDREIGHILFEIIVRSPGGKRDPSADYLESGGTEVDPAYRNKGVASTMYAYAKMLGNDIRPSYNQTSQGQAMWAAWNKAGDAKHLIGTAAESTMAENFADGKVKGKSRPGRVKRAGASCSGSVTDLRQRAKNASGEKARMYHWCANMKSGRKK